MTAGLSDEDRIDPPGMPTEGWKEGRGDSEEGNMMDGVRTRGGRSDQQSCLYLIKDKITGLMLN